MRGDAISAAPPDLNDYLEEPDSIEATTEELTQLLWRELRDRHFLVERDELGNLVLRLGSGRPNLLMVGELELDGPGHCLADMLSAALDLADPYYGSLTVAGVVEGGVAHLFEGLEAPDYVIMGEAIGSDRIGIYHRGAVQLEFEARGDMGRATHGESCIDDMIKCQSRLMINGTIRWRSS